MSSLVCVQVWEVCLSAGGRPYSGGWLPRVFVLVLALMFVVAVRLYGVGFSYFFCVCFVWSGFLCEGFTCSLSVLLSSGVTPAVSPVWGRADGTAAAVPAVTACRGERVLLTPSARTVGRPSSAFYS